MRGDGETIPQRFFAVAARRPDAVALRHKRRGLWQEMMWGEAAERVRSLASGLIRAGLQQGDVVPIVAESSPNGYLAQLAVQACGGIPVHLPATLHEESVEKAFEYLDACFVFAQDQEQVDKALSVRRSRCESLRGVIYWEERGLADYDHPLLLSWQSLLERGTEAGVLDERLLSGTAEDDALLVFASGSTRDARAGRHTHRSLQANASALASIHPRQPGEEYVSFAPMAWLVEQLLGPVSHVLFETVLNFAESPETARMDLREIAPRTLALPYRGWEALVTGIQDQLDEASWLMRRFAREALRGSPLARSLVLPALRDKLGLNRLVNGYITGGIPSARTLEFLQQAGLSLRQMYYCVEGGILTVERDPGTGTLGEPLPGVEMTIEEDGTLRFRGVTRFQGFYKDGFASLSAFDFTHFGQSQVGADQGGTWCRTGDLAALDSRGRLCRVARRSTLLDPAARTEPQRPDRGINPERVEAALRTIPGITDALLFSRWEAGSLCLLVTPNLVNLRHWADQRREEYQSTEELVRLPSVLHHVAEEIHKVAREQKVHIESFGLLHRPFLIDEGELTQAGALRRLEIINAHGAMIGAIRRCEPPAVRLPVTESLQSIQTGSSPMARAGSISEPA